MDSILKFIVRAEYNNIVIFIKSNNLNISFTNIFLCVIYCAINKIITDKQFFTLILLFINCNISMEDIGSPYYIIYLLGKLGEEFIMSKSHILKILNYKAKEKRLCNISYIFKKSPFNKNYICNKNGNFIADLVSIITIIVSYMSSHKISQYSNPIFPPISEECSYIQEEEILNRLISLKTIMSNKLLKYLGVNIITFGRFMIFNHTEKYQYYTSCIEEINISIRKILSVLDEYIILEKEINYCNNIIKKCYN